MRYRLMASYLGAQYQAAYGPGGNEVTLFAACPPPEEIGFSSAEGHWRKQVSLGELDGLFQSRPAGWYGGEPCLVLDDQGDRLHIAFLGSDPATAVQLGYWEIDREVFEVVTPRENVTDLTEDQITIPLTAVAIPVLLDAPAPAPVPADPAPLEPVVAEPAAERYAAPDRAAAWHGSPEPWSPYTADARPNGNGSGPATGSRAARRDRVEIQSVFGELLDLAAIPRWAYAVDDEVPGAMCLLKVEGGYEVFASSDDARHEVRFFDDEEAAYFYLFGVLAAEAVRNGALRPGAQSNSYTSYSEQLENVSKYLQARNCPNWPRNPVRVLNSRRG
ncbi:MAG TPA: hypothetical protein VFB06_05035 [Streptosporangiaceae bacterium]|nr:hypothetical protein [Streptosporangiaceae bacterium]